MSGLERSEFQRVLFQTAFCVMACDGHIDNREVAEIRAMNAGSAYFTGIDLTVELDGLLARLRTDGTRVVEDLFKTIENLDMSTVQELLLIEITLRIMNADERIDENEVRFLRRLRSGLALHNQTIKDRFGAVDFLSEDDYSDGSIIDASLAAEVTPGFDLPKIDELVKVDPDSFR